MKLVKIFFICIVNLAIFLGCQQNTQLLEVLYRDSMTDIKIHGSSLSYTWQAPPPGVGNLAGPESYVSQNVEVKLKPSQLEEIKQWMKEYHVFDFVKPDLYGEPYSPLADMPHDLKATLGNKTHSVDWTDASTWEDYNQQKNIENAVEALNRMCQTFIRQQKAVR